jgi:hypothetical protein
MEAVSLSFPAVVQLALSTGIVTAVLSQLLGWVIDYRKEQRTTHRDASYLALRLAVIMESYATDCAEAISDNDLFDSSEGHAGKQHAVLPKLAEYPPEIEWRSVDASLASRILSFRSEIVLADRSVAFWWEVGPENAGTECDSQTGKCGYRAWRLASDLRTRYSLPPLNISEHSWDPTKTLQEMHDRAIRQLRSNQCDNA